MTIIRIVRSSGATAGGPVGDEITTLRLTSGSSGTWPWTFAQVFKDGDVLSSQFLTTDANSTQADVRNRWPSGSAKLVVFSGVSTFVANATKTISISLVAGTPSGTNVAEPTSLDHQVVFTGDVTGTYTLQSCLGVDRSTWSKSSAGRVRSIPGLVMSEFHYYRPTTDAHVAVWFYVRAYATGAVEVETVIENGWLKVTSPALKTYTYTLSTNGATVASGSSLQHFHHTRWSWVNWISGGVAITPRHDVEYARSTTLVPNYGYTSPSASVLNALTQTLNPAPFNLGQWSSEMAATGTQTPIAILPQHEAFYWASGDPRAYKSTISNCQGSGRWPIYHRDETTGRIPLAASYPSNSLTSGWGTSVPQGTGGGPTWDIPHHPSMGYSAYLIEGRWSQLECCQMSAAFGILDSNTATRGASGVVLACINSPLTTRGWAWVVRSVVQAAAISPTALGASAPAAADAALQTSFGGCWKETTAYTKARFVDVGGAEYNTVGWVGHYGGDDDEGPANEFWGRAWMADFQKMAWAHGCRLGIEGLTAQQRSDAVDVCDHLHEGIVRLFGTDATWNFRRAATYNIPLQRDGAFLTTAEAFDSYQSFLGLSALSANPGDTLKNHASEADMTGTSSTSDTDGYWGIKMAALAFAVDDGHPDADTAYALASSASNFNPAAHGADDKPQFGIVPIETPAAPTALAIAASTLSPGQCVRFGTISQAVIQCAGENAPMTKYGSSGVWDPTRGEVGFIGKRDSSGFPYHWLMYTAATAAWASTTRAVWSGGETNQNGHGYDHNACDQVLGVRYHRPYDDTVVRYWNGSWGSLTAMGSPAPQIAGFLVWFPGIGLIYGDRRVLRKHPGASNPTAAWTTIQDLGSTPNAYHGVGEYNANSNVMIWGGGNADNAMKMMDSSQTITNIPTPPFNCGSSELQGLLCADPSGDGFIIWEKATSNWAFWKPGDVAWTTLTQSTGSGASPQNGTPNLTTDSAGRHSICIPIDDHGVIMIVQAGGTTADVWLYKHT